MAKKRSLPRYTGDLAGFVGVLRQQIFSSQAKAAESFGLNRSTIVRYEREELKPPLGYLACLARLVIDQLELKDVEEATTYQQTLLQQINEAIDDYYEDIRIQDWNELGSVADEYLTSRQNAQSPTSTASAEDGNSNVTAVGINSSFFIKALKDWNNDFFRWSAAKPHMRSSWAGLVLHALSAVTDRITPRGLLIFCVSLLLGIVTASLVMPVLQWPLGNSDTRWLACLKYGLATLLIPLLVAFVTPPEREGLFQLEMAKQKIKFWLLKFTGALVGFWVFSVGVIGLTLALYYLYVSPLAGAVRAILALVPLFFAYVAARRIPVDRHKMFNGELRLHPADWLFLVTFIFSGPLLSLFLYFFHWFLSDRTVAPPALLVILIGIALWEYKKQHPDRAIRTRF